jgi:transcriptional regulator GlxA family with amidase domain
MDLQAFIKEFPGLAVPALEFVDDADVVQCAGLVFFLIVPAK